MDAELDARLQLRGVKAITWNPAEQALVEREAEDPGVSGPGNLTNDDLARAAWAGVDELRHSSLNEEEAQAWAEAAWLKSKLSKVSGRVKCEGIASINPGDTVAIRGVGERFSGDVFVTGVRSEHDTVQGFKTHIQFGGGERWSAEKNQVAAP